MEPPPGAAESSKLRHVEKDILIPQIMRDRAKELCSDKVQGNCGKCIGNTGNKAILQSLMESLRGYMGGILDFITGIAFSYEDEKRMLRYYLQLHIHERKLPEGMITTKKTAQHLRKCLQRVEIELVTRQTISFQRLLMFFPEKTKDISRNVIIAFTKCCQETGLLMVVKCRQENTALKDCLVGYYSDPLFYEECKTEYLKQREEYRATGIKKKRQKLTSNV